MKKLISNLPLHPHTDIPEEPLTAIIVTDIDKDDPCGEGHVLAPNLYCWNEYKGWHSEIDGPDIDYLTEPFYWIDEEDLINAIERLLP